MKKIIYNDYNLKDEDMTEVVKRVKILLINSKNEVLLARSHNNYQFPGGHVEENESLIEALNREIKEEVGIELNISDLEPFACSIGYFKDWPEKGKNRKTEVYFYEVLSDLKPNIDKTEYTIHEKEGNFELKFIPLDKVIEELDNNTNKFGDEKGIAREMKALLDVYLKGEK